MADGSLLGSLMNLMKGDPSSFKETVNTAPPLASYPSDADAEYARANGFSEGNTHQQFLDNDKSRVLGRTISLANMPDSSPPYHSLPEGAVPLPRPAPPRDMFLPDVGIGNISNILKAGDNPKVSSVVDLNKPSNHGLSEDLHNLTMRAALAANRNPIAALGFDPTRIILDTLAGTRGTQLGGYMPSTDTVYSNVDQSDPSTMVHESTHRGLQKLRELYPDKAPALLGNMNATDGETTVRWLMNQTAGDPEGKAGPEDAKQRQSAIDTYNRPYTGHKGNLDQLQELAIDAMKNRGKRVGPQ